MISINRVSKSYGRSLVLDDVTVDLPAGGITCLIGPNGAGKSTLLSIIARLLGADAGTVSVAGLDVTRADTRELARTMAVLRQDTHLAVRLTVRDLVSFGRFPHNGGRPSRADRDAVAKAISWMDLDDLAERRLDEMSGGQRQRAFVAMVLAQDTPYVLLDEPLNNLDMTHATAMMRRLRAAADELGRTIVVVLHDVNYASCWADSILALRDGAIAAHGSPEEIMDTAVLETIYGWAIPIHELDGRRVAMYYA
ncbi:ABC transporter ATP-binding protein [Actinomyces slackii]|uniref:Probable siderophore transport system ATP-binding protein YusV n=1 Tax=Actinomyces slackii TaxID=52774 RepID=A0A448KFS7_9ACTO|nr:ATP-binding cassette domain-containing protein [Actinomyces slackii]VEG75752.1 Probable siderophore transport system ATP-binding protein YusV [Actinomyces slackii]